MAKLVLTFMIFVFFKESVLTDTSVPAENTESERSRKAIEINLKNGTVKGSTNYVEFLYGPTPTRRSNCDGQAVLRINMTGPYDTVRLVLQYARPRMWTVHAADTLSDGLGGGPNNLKATAEAHIHNRQLRIYSSQLEGYHDATINGGMLLKVVDGVVADNSTFVLQVSDQRLEWQSRRQHKHFLESRYLYRWKADVKSVTTATDAPEFTPEDSFLFIGLNRVAGASFRKGAGLCKATIVLIKKAAAHCTGRQTGCHKNAHCYDTRHSYRCRCNPGFYGNGIICEDDNECEYNNGGCMHTCTNLAGNYSCSCHGGFALAAEGHDCRDINECLVNKGGCSHECINTLGSYECRCPRGQVLAQDSHTCTALDWCMRRYECEHYCRSGSAQKCFCRPDYQLHSDGKSCIRTCALGNGGCHHLCTDTESGPVCACRDNYNRNQDHATCTVTCGVNNGGCEKRCNDTVSGPPQCSCPPGLLLAPDAKTCLDIDECQAGEVRCSHDCVNTHGSFECICPRGFAVAADGLICLDVNECEYNNTCDHICYNTPGSFQCLCYTGYSLYGCSHCADDDECAAENGGCQHTCHNHVSGYTCSCHAGYSLHSNGRDCLETQSCITPKVGVNVEMRCQEYAPAGSVQCVLTCAHDTYPVLAGNRTLTVQCGPQTGFTWISSSVTLESFTCSHQISSAGFKREISLMFLVDDTENVEENIEGFKYDFLSTITDIHADICQGLCRITNVERTSRIERRKYIRYTVGTGRRLGQVTFTIHLDSQPIKNNCDGACSKRKLLVKHKKALKGLRKALQRGYSELSLAGSTYSILSNSVKRTLPTPECPLGHVLVSDICVACSNGSYYDMTANSCRPCVPGFYQDREGQIACVPCPHNRPGVGLTMAVHVSECNEQCEPGTYSQNGLKPCNPCPRGTYQNQHGRLSCTACGQGISTSQPGATGFQYCQTKVHCRAGEFYDTSSERCIACPRDQYQPMEQQNFCYKCPGNTRADEQGSVNSGQCKALICGGFMSKYKGLIETPNWPGDYPIDTECIWRLSPPKGRRILIVIPEVALIGEDRCGDKLVMRKSASKYSVLTYETCESTTAPLAITALSRKLWIQFKSDSQHTTHGFSIPYVMYDEEYQELIEDIVRDGRLYSHYQHQQVLQNRHLLSALLEVIAEPHKYFNYVNTSESMFPETFIRLLRNKVVRFFSRP